MHKGIDLHLGDAKRVHAKIGGVQCGLVGAQHSCAGNYFRKDNVLELVKSSDAQ